MPEIKSPFPVFPDTSGDPLDGGAVYVGKSGLNPKTNPSTVYWDKSLTDIAAQPISTINGYLSRNGSPARIYAAEPSWSIAAFNKNGTNIFSVLDATDSGSSSSSAEFQKTFGSSKETDFVAWAATGAAQSDETYKSLGANEAGDTGSCSFRCEGKGVSLSATATSLITVGTVVVSSDDDGLIYIPVNDSGTYDSFKPVSSVMKPEMFGADITGATASNAAIYQAFRASLIDRRGVVVFEAHNYSVDDRIRPTNTGESFLIYSKGAKIKLLDGAGCQFLAFFSANTNPDLYEDNYVIFKGHMNIDANGRNQQFANAQRIRTGQGTIEASWNTTQGQAYAAAYADVFGSRVLSSANNDAAEQPELVEVGRYDYVYWEGIHIKDRVEDGLVAADCRIAIFNRCTDKDGINTNDQSAISLLLGGVDTGGHQHFAFKGSQARSWGVLKLNVTGSISIGDTVTGEDSEANGVVFKIDGDDYYISDVKKGRFNPSENIQVSGSTQATCTYFDLNARGITIVNDCYAEDGNTCAGYVGITQDTPGSGLFVHGGGCKNQGTAGYRMEGGEFCVIDVNHITNTCLTGDKQKKIIYPSQQGVNCSNSAKYVHINIKHSLNLRTDFEESIDLSRGMARVSGFFECDDSDPLVLADGVTPSSLVAFVDGNVRCTGKMKGVKNQSGDFVVSNGLRGTAGFGFDIEFDTIKNVLNSCQGGKNIRGSVCNSVAVNVFATSQKTIDYDEIRVEDVEGNAFQVRGNSGPKAFVIKDAQLSRVQGNAVAAADTNVEVLEISQCTFTDIGLDTSLTSAERAIVGGVGGMGADRLVMTGNTFIKEDSNAHDVIYETASAAEQMHENGNVEQGAVFRRVRATGGQLQFVQRAKTFEAKTISSGTITLDKPTDTVSLLPESGNSDTLDDIDYDGVVAGDEIFLTTTAGGNTITISDGTGNLYLNGNFTISSVANWIHLKRAGANWHEISRSSNT